MKTLKQSVNQLSGRSKDKSQTLREYKGVEFLDVLTQWCDREYYWFVDGKLNSCNNIAVFHHCIDTEPVTEPVTEPILSEVLVSIINPNQWSSKLTYVLGMITLATAITVVLTALILNV